MTRRTRSRLTATDVRPPAARSVSRAVCVTQFRTSLSRRRCRQKIGRARQSRQPAHAARRLCHCCCTVDRAARLPTTIQSAPHPRRPIILTKPASCDDAPRRSAILPSRRRGPAWPRPVCCSNVRPSRSMPLPRVAARTPGNRQPPPIRSSAATSPTRVTRQGASDALGWSYSTLERPSHHPSCPSNSRPALRMIVSTLSIGSASRTLPSRPVIVVARNMALRIASSVASTAA